MRQILIACLAYTLVGFVTSACNEVHDKRSARNDYPNYPSDADREKSSRSTISSPLTKAQFKEINEKEGKPKAGFSLNGEPSGLMCAAYCPIREFLFVHPDGREEIKAGRMCDHFKSKSELSSLKYDVNTHSTGLTYCEFVTEAAVFFTRVSQAEGFIWPSDEFQDFYGHGPTGDSVVVCPGILDIVKDNPFGGTRTERTNVFEGDARDPADCTTTRIGRERFNYKIQTTGNRGKQEVIGLTDSLSPIPVSFTAENFRKMDDTRCPVVGPEGFQSEKIEFQTMVYHNPSTGKIEGWSPSKNVSDCGMAVHYDGTLPSVATTRTEGAYPPVNFPARKELALHAKVGIGFPQDPRLREEETDDDLKYCDNQAKWSGFYTAAELATLALAGAAGGPAGVAAIAITAVTTTASLSDSKKCYAKYDKMVAGLGFEAEHDRQIHTGENEPEVHDFLFPLFGLQELLPAEEPGTTGEWSGVPRQDGSMGGGIRVHSYSDWDARYWTLEDQYNGSGLTDQSRVGLVKEDTVNRNYKLTGTVLQPGERGFVNSTYWICGFGEQVVWEFNEGFKVKGDKYVKKKWERDIQGDDRSGYWRIIHKLEGTATSFLSLPLRDSSNADGSIKNTDGCALRQEGTSIDPWVQARIDATKDYLTMEQVKNFESEGIHLSPWGVLVRHKLTITGRDGGSGDNNCTDPCPNDDSAPGGGM